MAATSTASASARPLRHAGLVAARRSHRFHQIRQQHLLYRHQRPDGSGERLLTQSFLVEGPTWAPNGRVLAYFRQTQSDARGNGGRSRLYSIDLTGYNEREMVTPQDASDPAWSPLLP